MTDIEVITAANDSGLTYYGMGKDRAKFLHHLEAFAALVAAHERDACAKACENINSIEDYYEERTELVCAEAIRARGTT